MLGGMFAAPPTGPQLPPKPKIKPSVPMRKLHWAQLDTKVVPGSMWKDIDEKDVKIDTTEFEALFCAVAPKKAAVEKTPAQLAEEEKKKKAAEAVQLIKLVDDKRSYNCDITLARFRMTHEHIRDSVLAMDEEVLPLEKLTGLIKIAPTIEEIELVKAHTGGPLANTERFYLTLSVIPRLLNRLELWAFKQQFDGLASATDASLVCVESAIKEIRNSKSLTTILKTVLAFGNYMNGGTPKGQAYGFKLSALTKLENSKTWDNSSTLLDYVVSYIENKQPKAKGFADELGSVNAASRVEATFLTAEIRKMGGSLNQIKNELSKPGASAVDRFGPTMQKFYDSAHTTHAALNKRLEQAEKDYKALLAFMGEEGDTKWEEFFKLFDSFVMSWKKSQSDMQAKAERAEKEKAREKAKQDKQKAKEDAASGSMAPPPGMGPAGAKLRKMSRVSQMYQSLKSGDMSNLEKLTHRKSGVPLGACPPPMVPTQAALVQRRMSSKRGQLAAMIQGAATANVAPCSTCGCNDFKKHPFKKDHCNQCFHNH